MEQLTQQERKEIANYRIAATHQVKPDFSRWTGATIRNTLHYAQWFAECEAAERDPKFAVSTYLSNNLADFSSWYKRQYLKPVYDCDKEILKRALNYGTPTSNDSCIIL